MFDGLAVVEKGLRWLPGLKVLGVEGLCASKLLTVCDPVDTTQALNGLTVINFGGAFPKQLLSVVIHVPELTGFADPGTDLYKGVCDNGKLVLYNEGPRIVVNEAGQFKMGR